MLPKTPRDEGNPPEDPPPMLFEPEEFPEGLVPIPGERFTHGNWPGGIFFRDKRFPGKTFIYAFTYSPNANPQRLEEDQYMQEDDDGVPEDEQLFDDVDNVDNVDDVDDTGEASLYHDGMVRSDDQTSPAYESTVPEVTDTETATEQVTKDVEENVITGLADQPYSTEECVENAVEESQEGESEISPCELANRSDASSQPRHSSNVSVAYDHLQDADLGETAIDLEDATGFLQAYERMPAEHIEQLIDDQSSSYDAASTKAEGTLLVSLQTPQPPGTNSDYFHRQRHPIVSFRKPITGPQPQEDSEYFIRDHKIAPEPEHSIEDQNSATEVLVSISLQPSSVGARDSMDFETESSATGLVSDVASGHDTATAPAPPVQPEPYSEQEPMDFEANAASADVRSDEYPDPEPFFEEETIFSDTNAEILALYESLQAIDAAQEERKAQLQKRIREGVDIPSPEEINQLLDFKRIREEAIAGAFGKKLDESREVTSHPVEPVVTESNTPEPIRPKQLCDPGHRHDIVPRRLPRSVFGIDVPDCETFCQGLTGVILVFYFFRPDKIPYFVQRRFAGRISPTTVSQWWWLRLMLGFMIIVRLSEWGRPEGLFEPVCHIEKAERWPQIWYYPDSAIPRFAPRADVTERERRW